MATTTALKCASIDDTFGPWAGPGCRGSFDFTLRFEELFLSILPLALILAVATFRIFYLWRKQNKVRRSKLLYWKLVGAIQTMALT
jgi:ATP-binding cassette subfamily C (CFTR/MRP) protein 1